MKSDNRDQTINKIWSDLLKLSSDAHKINILDLFKSQKNRAQTMSAKSEGIFFDFSNKVSLGANFNRGLKLVKSDYFCIMHADDLYEKDYLKKISSKKLK